MSDSYRKRLACFSVHQNTLNEYDKEISEARLNDVLENITNSQSIIDGTKTCYIYGMGAHPKSTYQHLSKVDGVEVVCSRSIIPSYVSFFRLAIASYAGLIKVYNAKLIKNVFSEVVSRSMAGIFCFDPDIEGSFIENVKQDPLPKFLDFSIKVDKGYFIYIVDADSLESSTGIYEIVSFGVDTPGDLISCL